MDDELETILVVEDDAGVRSLTRRILDDRGYHVLEASDPAEALEVARSYEHHINLLLSDVIMPGSGSVSLFEELVRQRSGLRILYMSGSADETIVRHGLLVDAPFLQKPFTATDLVEKVREVLDSPAVQTHQRDRGARPRRPLVEGPPQEDRIFRRCGTNHR
jgi:two-component system cell cycle sensor histidine kinase/response regulator CckA